MFTLLVSLAFAEEVTQEDLKDQGGTWFIERTITIDAPAATVTPYLSDLTTWEEWTAWNAEMDPECVWDYSGDANTVGHTMHWVGPEMGEGWVTVTQVTDSEVRYDLWFNKKKGTAGKGRFEVSETDGVTTVVWSDVGKVGFFGRLFIPKINEMLIADFDEGLQGVKAAAEADHSEFLEAEEARLKLEAEARLKAEEEAALEAEVPEVEAPEDE